MLLGSFPRQAAIVLLAFLVAVPAVLMGMEPPRPDQREKYIADGSWQERLNRAEHLGNHRTSPRLVANVKRKLAKAAGKSDAQVSAMMAGPAGTPPPAWQGGLPSIGSPKVPVLLVDFPEYPHEDTDTQADIDDKFFGNGDSSQSPYESLHNFYLRSSYNKLDIQGHVFDWYRAQHSRAYYESLSTSPSDGTGQETLMKEVISYWNATHDFSQYDNDGNGVVDAIYIKWTGPDEGWSSFWWAYQWTWHSTSFSVDGVEFGSYVWSWIHNSGYDGKTIYQPHVDIHETGHLLGLPDLYDYQPYTGPEGGVGGLDMMDHNWGDHNCFSKYMLDWLTPTEVLSGTQTLALRPSGSSEDCVLIMSNLDPGTMFDEFFMVQYRKRSEGNDAWMPTDGYLIWHVDSTLNNDKTDFLYDNSYSIHKYMQLLQADGLNEIEQLIDYADPGDFYTAGDTLGLKTNPNSNNYANQRTGVNVKDIGDALATMSGTFKILPPVEMVAGAISVPEESCTPANGGIDPGETVTVDFELRNVGWGSTTDLKATLRATGGVSAPGDEVDVGVVAAGEAALATIEFTADGKCGDTITMTLDLTEAGEALDPVVFTYVLGYRVTAQSFDSVSAGYMPSGWVAPGGVNATAWTTDRAAFYSAPNAVYAMAPGEASENRLYSPIVSMGSSSGKVTFWQRYDLEEDFDGGVLEISIGAAPFQDILDAGGRFLSGGYTGEITTTQNPLGERAAWNGSTGQQFVLTEVILPSSARGKDVRLRWRLGTNNNIATGGWWIDDIQIIDNSTCCDPLSIVTESDYLTVSEGGNRTLQIKLASAPAGNKVVTIARTDGDASLSVQGVSTLTFNGSDWNTFQTVTLAAAEDDDAVSSMASFKCTAPGLHERSLYVSEEDNDVLLFALDKTSMEIADSTTDTFKVHLTAQPTSDLAVAVTRAWGDSCISVSAGGSLTFTTLNWMVDQTVTVLVTPDADANVGVAAIRCTADGIPDADVNVRQLDSDVVQMTVSQDPITLVEGQTTSFQVKLANAPVGPVTLAVGLAVGETGVTVESGKSLLFTPANYNVWQTAVIRADQDADSDNNDTTLVLNGTGIFEKQLAVHITDDDTYSLDVPTTSLSVPEGQVAIIHVRLGAKPPASVSVQATIAGDSDLSILDGNTLVFSTSDWNQYRTITLYAAEDDDALQGQATVHLAAAGIPAVDVVAREADNDHPGIVVSTSTLSVPENSTATFGVRLATPPAADTTVNIEMDSGDSNISIQSGSSLVFTPANWKSNQTVVVAAARDLDVTSSQATIRVSSSGLTDKTVSATEADDLIVYPTFYRDADGDEAGDPEMSQQAFEQPQGYVLDHSDCDDTNPDVHPGAVEVCDNAVDDNCDGHTNEGCPSPTADSDNDGVSDEQDNCPNTPSGTQVDSHGCPVIQPDNDADGDGVEDAQDNCPNTPSGTQVDSNGCPVIQPDNDADSDGVEDAQDNCPNTPSGTQVDSHGCPVTQPDNDADGDGVLDANDNCPDTPAGTQVDSSGCALSGGGGDDRPAPVSCGTGLGTMSAALLASLWLLQSRRRVFARI